MAGNKINTKKKDDKNKMNRGTGQGGEENEEDIDFSLLRKPILTSITGFAQARKIFDQATEELKSLLTNECDLLYECKVCRNIFRSLANFISHKRVYCKENFNSSIHGHFMKEPCTIQEVLKIRKLEESYQESLLENKIPKTLNEDENDDRIPMSKDITEVLEKIVKSKGVKEKEIEEQQLVFQKIPKSSVAVFQNIDNSNNSDNMRNQVKELDHILSQENAVLQSDGTFTVQSNNVPADNIIQISDDDENENTVELKCKICDLQFSTLKTLKFHMKYKHVESRLVYPCPDCIDIFSTSWSVYRHLFKVHRKTAAQIRRLRESIQAKAFRMNNPPAFYEKRRTVPKIVPPQKITEEERLDQENQAWLEELDGESEGRRCGGCGRTFERRAALAAHAHTCARRHRRRIGIQIRKDYHKDHCNPYLQTVGIGGVAEPKTTPEETPPESKPIEKDTKEVNEETTQVDEEMPSIEEQKEESDDKEMVPEVSVQNKPFLFDSLLMNKIPFAQQAEKSNLAAFKQKMLPDIETDQLICKKCNAKHDEINDLLNHMAAHYKWIRYACKLCNFKHFNFEKLPEHVKIVHKLKGDTDFYYSTVKAVDGTEALELVETVEEGGESNEVSPDSRRPSRCSSDSSRLSDDSSSSSTRIEGSRKRKANRYSSNVKKKKEKYIEEAESRKDDDSQKEKEAILSENDTSSNSKVFEDNSSDFDEIDEKIKRQVIKVSTVTSRRPVRKKTKPKNEDFEYDLSNLLKLEAQGYRDSQTVSTKSTQSKKKVQQDLQQNYEAFNKDCCGALVTLSWKSAGKAQGHMKTLGVFTSKEPRISSTFVRPMVPKINRMDKVSPKKDEKETASPVKVVELPNLPSPHKNVSKNIKKDDVEQKTNETPELQVPKSIEETPPTNDSKSESVTNESNKSIEESKSVETDKRQSLETPKPNLNVPILPIKFRRQSLEVIKNPLIKKNITDFTKAGMKTKILVIKPINRNNDGPNSINAPLKYQTIKLKDPTKAASNEEKKDQVVVVQVPKVDTAVNKPISNSTINTITSAPAENISATSEKEVSANDIELSEVVEIVPESENSTEQTLCDSQLTNTINELPIDSKTVNLEGC